MANNESSPDQARLPVGKWLLVTLAVIVLDQVTKYMATVQLDYGNPLAVLPSFNLTLLHNTGAAFSFLADQSGWQRWFFATVSLLASVFILVWLRKLTGAQKPLALALALILGGALGNLIDRALFGYVIDFIQVYYRDLYWPAFNIADSAISIGAAVLIGDALFRAREKR